MDWLDGLPGLDSVPVPELPHVDSRRINHEATDLYQLPDALLQGSSQPSKACHSLSPSKSHKAVVGSALGSGLDQGRESMPAVVASITMRPASAAPGPATEAALKAGAANMFLRFVGGSEGQSSQRVRSITRTTAFQSFMSGAKVDPKRAFDMYVDMLQAQGMGAEEMKQRLEAKLAGLAAGHSTSSPRAAREMRTLPSRHSDPNPGFHHSQAAAVTMPGRSFSSTGAPGQGVRLPRQRSATAGRGLPGHTSCPGLSGPGADVPTAAAPTADAATRGPLLDNATPWAPSSSPPAGEGPNASLPSVFADPGLLASLQPQRCPLPASQQLASQASRQGRRSLGGHKLSKKPSTDKGAAQTPQEEEEAGEEAGLYCRRSAALLSAMSMDPLSPTRRGLAMQACFDLDDLLLDGCDGLGALTPRLSALLQPLLPGRSSGAGAWLMSSSAPPLAWGGGSPGKSASTLLQDWMFGGGGMEQAAAQAAAEAVALALGGEGRPVPGVPGGEGEGASAAAKQQQQQGEARAMGSSGVPQSEQQPGVAEGQGAGGRLEVAKAQKLACGPAASAGWLASELFGAPDTATSSAALMRELEGWAGASSGRALGPRQASHTWGGLDMELSSPVAAPGALLGDGNSGSSPGRGTTACPSAALLPHNAGSAADKPGAKPAAAPSHPTPQPTRERGRRSGSGGGYVTSNTAQDHPQPPPPPPQQGDGTLVTAVGPGAPSSSAAVAAAGCKRHRGPSTSNVDQAQGCVLKRPAGGQGVGSPLESSPEEVVAGEEDAALRAHQQLLTALDRGSGAWRQGQGQETQTAQAAVEGELGLGLESLPKLNTGVGSEGGQGGGSLHVDIFISPTAEVAAAARATHCLAYQPDAAKPAPAMAFQRSTQQEGQGPAWGEGQEGCAPAATAPGLPLGGLSEAVLLPGELDGAELQQMLQEFCAGDEGIAGLTTARGGLPAGASQPCCPRRAAVSPDLFTGGVSSNHPHTTNHQQQQGGQYQLTRGDLPRSPPQGWGGEGGGRLPLPTISNQSLPGPGAPPGCQRGPPQQQQQPMPPPLPCAQFPLGPAASAPHTSFPGHHHHHHHHQQQQQQTDLPLAAPRPLPDTLPLPQVQAGSQGGPPLPSSFQRWLVGSCDPPQPPPPAAVSRRTSSASGPRAPAAPPTADLGAAPLTWTQAGLPSRPAASGSGLPWPPPLCSTSISAPTSSTTTPPRGLQGLASDSVACSAGQGGLASWAAALGTPPQPTSHPPQHPRCSLGGTGLGATSGIAAGILQDLVQGGRSTAAGGLATLSQGLAGMQQQQQGQDAAEAMAHTGHPHYYDPALFTGALGLHQAVTDLGEAVRYPGLDYGCSQASTGLGAWQADCGLGLQGLLLPGLLAAARPSSPHPAPAPAACLSNQSCLSTAWQLPTEQLVQTQPDLTGMSAPGVASGKGAAAGASAGARQQGSQGSRGAGSSAKPASRARASRQASRGSGSEDDGGAGADDGLDDDGAVFIRSANGGEQRCITKALLQEVYHLPINEAADQLGIGVTVLKKYCRRFQIGRWPFRKLKSMDKLIRSVEEQHTLDPQGASYVLAELQRSKEEIYANPEVVLDERIKRLRQANFKMEYKARQHTTVGAGGDAAGSTEMSWPQELRRC